MNKKETAMMMAVLRASYPGYYKGMGQAEAAEVVNVWADMFADYPANVVMAAVKAFIATDTKGFPPVIGQIMDKVRKIVQPERISEAEAWGLVLKALQNSGYNSRDEFGKLPPEVRTVVHSPEQLKSWAIDDNFNEAVVSSNFMRAYRTESQRREEYDAMPADVQRLADALSGKLALESGGESDDGRSA